MKLKIKSAKKHIVILQTFYQNDLRKLHKYLWKDRLHPFKICIGLFAPGNNQSLCLS